MGTLTLTSNIAAPDDIYQLLVDAHDGLSDHEVMTFNVSLALLLINHIGDMHVAQEAMAAARSAAQARRSG